MTMMLLSCVNALRCQVTSRGVSFLRRTSALPWVAFRFAVTRNTLTVQLTLPLAGRVKDFRIQVGTRPGAQKKTPRLRGVKTVR